MFSELFSLQYTVEVLFSIMVAFEYTVGEMFYLLVGLRTPCWRCFPHWWLHSTPWGRCFLIGSFRELHRGDDVYTVVGLLSLFVVLVYKGVVMFSLLGFWNTSWW